MILLLLACAKKAPPPLYPLPIPPMGSPEYTDIPARADACPVAVAMKPGQAVSYIDDDGRATCRAQIIPERKVLELFQTEAHRDFWHSRADTCHEYRALDRATAEAAVSRARTSIHELEGELRLQRLVQPVAFVCGVVLGAGIGIAAAKIAL